MKKLILFLISSFLFLLFSCKILNGGESIIGFMEESSRKVSIDKTVFSGAFQTDADGYISIPSNADAYVDYLIWNPEGLAISKYGIQTAENIGLNYVNPGSDGEHEEYFTIDGKTVKLLMDSGLLTDESANPLRYTVSKKDEHLIRLSLPQEFLYRLEYSLNGGPGIDFNGALGIHVPDYDYKPVSALINKAAPENENGNISVNIEPYLPKIRINTPPPPVQGACVMVDNSTSGGNYVLCFNLPDCLFLENGIHRDMQGDEYGEIYIEGIDSSFGRQLSKGIKLKIQPDTEEGDGSKGSFTDTLSSVLPSDQTVLTKIWTRNQESEHGMPAASFYPGNHPVYILDEGHTLRKSLNMPYRITLKDQKGLVSVVELNSLYYQLLPVTAQNGGKTYSADYETGRTSIYFPFDLKEDGSDAQQFKPLELVAPSKVEGGVGSQGSTGISVSDVDIYYEIFSKDILRDPHNLKPVYSDIGLYETNIARDSKLLLLKNHTIYRISAYARKPGYLDSRLSTWYVTSGNYRYQDVSVQAGSVMYGVEFEFDRWDDSWGPVNESGEYDPSGTYGEYNFKIYDLEENGTHTYTFDVDLNVGVRIYDLKKFRADGTKEYLSDEDALKLVKNIKVVLRENSGIEMMSYVDNEKLLSVLNDRSGTDISSDSEYVAANGTPVSGRQLSVPLSLPHTVPVEKTVPYRIEVYAEIGGDAPASYHETYNIPLRVVEDPFAGP